MAICQRLLYVAETGSDKASGTISAPFKSIQFAVNKAYDGDIIYIRGGVYRESININRNGLNILAYPGEKPFIKGSVVMTGWMPHGTFWKKFVAIRPQQVMVNGDNPLQQIGYPNSDFQNNQSYPRYNHPVGLDLSDMSPGRFFWQNDTLYIMLRDSGDPNRQTIEVSQLRQLMFIDASSVHIKGLYFRHTSSNTFGEFGAGVELGENSLIEDCDVQWCDFGGIAMGYTKTGARALRCNASNNGSTGFNASASFNFLISSCKANGNNYRNFYAQWHAGGFKGATEAWGTIENSEFANNIGAGIWFDYCYSRGNYRFDGTKPIIIRNNYIHDNSKTTNKNSALMIEVSEKASIQNNLVINNDYRGIYIAASWDCDVVNNVVAYTQLHHGIDLNGMPRQGARLTNNYVANNILYDNNTADDMEILDDNGTDVRNNVADYNIIYRSNGNIKMRYGSNIYTGLNEWKQNAPFIDNSFSANPEFLDNKFHLSAKSPAIDAGTGPITEVAEKDYEGNNRLIGKRIDPGVYEYSFATDIESGKDENNKMRIYPNPASSFITVNIREMHPVPDLIRIISLTGQIVHEEKMKGENEIRIPVRLASGLYIVQIGSGDIMIYTQKILINR